MRAFIVRRIAYGLVLLVAISAFIFGMSRLAGDPREVWVTPDTLGGISQERWDAWGKEMGLDKPLVVQYLIWASKAVQGNLGESTQYHRNAIEPVIARLPATIQLAAAAWFFSVVIGVPLGILSAIKRGSFWDYLVRTSALIAQAMPGFWLGLVLIIVFAVQLDLLPSGRRGGIDHLILPAVTLGLHSAAGLLRLVRSSMLEVLDSEFVKFARAKGVGSWAIIWKHALRNAIIAPLTFAGLLLATFLTGAVVTETVFSWPGIGRLAVGAIYQNDFPLLASVVMLFSLLYVGTSLLVDVAYAFLDPRIRYE
ncbi:MAG: ABC transporter permease [Chloroflexi bacterium]|nr:ABC transporter permease [Chloroflexota bacterium]